MRQLRSSSFFYSDVMSLAEDMAYRLAEDYGLSEDQASELVDSLERTTTEFFREVRDSC